MEAKRPIYEHIMSSVVDGKLPVDFSLVEYDESDFKIRMADGAMDGISVYHMSRPTLPEDIVGTIAQALEAACAGDYETAGAKLSSLLDEHRAINLIGQIQQAVIEVAPKVDPQALYAYATFPIFTSTDREMVKMGLSILEVFNEPDDKTKELIRTFGLCDEFTIFCAWNARTWTNGNEEVFSLAKRTDGWGRIHAIEILEPATDEIRDWLLLEGVNNAVMPEYSALTCYVKAGVAERLVGEMTHEEFSGATSIVHAALSEGPVAGIPSLDDPKAELERYVHQAPKQKLDLWDCECIDSIAEYAAEEGWDGLVNECDALLGADVVRSLVKDELTKGHGMGLARQLGIPYKDALLEAMQSDFDGLYSQCHWLMDDAEYLDALLELFREKIPIDCIEDDPRDEIGIGKEFDAYRKLSFLIQSLRHKLPTGLDFVLKALTSPVVSNRTMAYRVLRCWVSDEGRSLSEISPEAFERLCYAYGREPREDLSCAMKPLIDGETVYGEDEM